MEVREANASYAVAAQPPVDAVPFGYKQTEVGVIPEDWNVKRLGELFDITSSKRVFQSEWKAEGIPFYRARELAVLAETGAVDNALFITRDKYSAFKMAHGVPATGDLLVTGVGTLGKVYLVGGDHEFYFKDGNIIWFKIAGSLVSEFLRQLYLTPLLVKQISDGSAGTTVGTYTITGAKATVIPLPSRQEQRAVAEALSDSDALIESLEQLIAKKRQIKQGIMQALLTGKQRLPGFAEPWATVQLGDIADVKTGPFGSALHESDYVQSGTPIITVEHLGEFGITRQNMPLVSDNDRKRLCAYVLEAGDIVFSRVGSVDRNALVSQKEAGWLFSGRLLRVRVDAVQVFAPYLSFQFHTEEFKQLVLAVAVGQTMASLNTKILKEISVRLPALPEQTAIATILTDMDIDLAALETRLTKTRQLKQGMMQELLTGRIRLVQPVSTVVPLPKKKRQAATAKPHNHQINEAVVIAALTKHFGSENWPLARVRRTKLAYLLHRHAEGKAVGFLKKAAGPYDPSVRYGGPESIALKNGYVRARHNGEYGGFVASENIAEAEAYFEKWYGADAMVWLEQFHWRKTEELELLTTVDMAAEDLRREGKLIGVDAVKQLIHDHPEWKPKLDRAIFSDDGIAAALAECQILFKS